MSQDKTSQNQSEKKCSSVGSIGGSSSIGGSNSIKNLIYWKKKSIIFKNKKNHTIEKKLLKVIFGLGVEISTQMLCGTKKNFWFLIKIELFPYTARTKNQTP